MSGLLGLERRLGPQARPFLDACRAAGVQRAGAMELREAAPRGGPGGSGGDGDSEGVMGDKHQAVLETLRGIGELSDYDILPEVRSRAPLCLHMHARRPSECVGSCCCVEWRRWLACAGRLSMSRSQFLHLSESF